MIKRALYAGTFAPITLGHLDIIEQAHHIFDELVIAVSSYQRDDSGLTQVCRIALIEQATKHLSRVKVIPLKGSLVRCAQENQVDWLVRGLRNMQDFSIEHQMANMNQQLQPHFRTIFLLADPRHQSINATLVRQLIACKEDISAFVPANVVQWVEVLS